MRAKHIIGHFERAKTFLTPKMSYQQNLYFTITNSFSHKKAMPGIKICCSLARRISAVLLYVFYKQNPVYLAVLRDTFSLLISSAEIRQVFYLSFVK
jgi:hypothetical protein